jgi:hypothetical protein
LHELHQRNKRQLIQDDLLKINNVALSILAFCGGDTSNVRNDLQVILHQDSFDLGSRGLTPLNPAQAAAAAPGLPGDLPVQRAAAGEGRRRWRRRWAGRPR